MRRDEIADLAAFVVVAEERSFTKAAQRLGMAQSALSQIVRRTEERLRVRLLSRTTRSVAPTEAGERLIATLGPMLHDLDALNRHAEHWSRSARLYFLCRYLGLERPTPQVRALYAELARRARRKHRG